ncbi:MAG: hypothetical protein IJX34_04135 [Clostridia bacterium]|nr:hypothetical protein [Clostridia bacterium]
MKRWAIVLISITLCMVLGNSVYATENVDIYQEPQVQHKGRVVMNFYSTDSKEYITNSSPIENVQVELYYRYKKVMYNVKELDLFQYTNLNLVSDENGKIILSNLPYGLYQYKIVSAPKGFEFDTELKTLDLNLMNETINEEVYLLKQIIMAEGTTEEIVDIPKEEIIQNNTQIIPDIKEDEKVEQIVIVGKKDEEAIKKNVNNLATNLYIASEPESVIQNTTLTEDKQVMQQVSQELTKKAKEKKVDMISEMRKTRITESIRVAVVSMDDTMYYLKTLSDNDRQDLEKVKDCKKRVLDRLNDKKYKNQLVSRHIRNIKI